MNSDIQNSLIEAYKVQPIINNDVSTTSTFNKRQPVWKDSAGRTYTQSAYEAQKRTGNNVD
jgi:hypothetical protein